MIEVVRLIIFLVVAYLAIAFAQFDMEWMMQVGTWKVSDRVATMMIFFFAYGSYWMMFSTRRL